MKRLIAFILVLVMVLGLTSCDFALGMLSAIEIPYFYIDYNGKGVYRFTELPEKDKALFREYIGTEIPFPPCDYYTLGGYYVSDEYEYGMHLLIKGNTREEFESYLEEFSDYTLTKTYEDLFGDIWHRYIKDDVVVEVSYYKDIAIPYIDVYVYSSLSEEYIEGSRLPSENLIIKNEGAGLPKGEGGVYIADFAGAEHVKNVTDQYTYDGGCPTVGSPAVLVIPIEFPDARAKDLGYTTKEIESALLKGGKNNYYSLYDYYYKSSYGQLTLDITVLDEWFMTSEESSEYTMYSWWDLDILHEALDYLEDKMDLSKFDSDKNGTIDSVVMVNTLDVGTQDIEWAFRSWNIRTDSDDEPYEYDGVSARDYIWASYQFLYETVDEEGEVSYDGKEINPLVFIHEFGHVLGADDYYDTEYLEHPMDGRDVMDSSTGDHNPYTKFNYGWITTSRLVTADADVTLTLEDFSKAGDTVIIANNWDESLGAYQEYYVLVYYKAGDLNPKEGGCFESDGVVVYHVNSSLYPHTKGGETVYDVYNNNASPKTSYGSVDNLIELVASEDGDYIFGIGESLPNVTDDFGEELRYTFTVRSIKDGEATLVISAT
jgi:M6 family metalloprotease-like protein